MQALASKPRSAIGHGEFKPPITAENGASRNSTMEQAELSSQRPFGVGCFALISNQAAYVTHPDPQEVGQAASDLSSEAKHAIKAGQPSVDVDDQGVARLFHPIHTGSSETPWSLMMVFDIAAALAST